MEKKQDTSFINDIRVQDLKESIGSDNIKLLLNYIKIKVAQEKNKSCATNR